MRMIDGCLLLAAGLFAGCGGEIASGDETLAGTRATVSMTLTHQLYELPPSPLTNPHPSVKVNYTATRSGGNGDYAAHHKCLSSGLVVQESLNRFYWEGPGRKIGNYNRTIWSESDTMRANGVVWNCEAWIEELFYADLQPDGSYARYWRETIPNTFIQYDVR